MTNKAKVREYAEKWREIGLRENTGPFIEKEKREIEQNLREAYKVAGFPPPSRFFYEPSPVAGYNKAVELTGETNLHTCWGVHDSDWFAVFDYYLNEEKDKTLEVTVPMMNLAKLGVGWFWPLDEATVISERPIKVELLNNRLYCDGGPAISYRDGSTFHCLNGVKVPKEVAETPAEKLGVDLIFKTKNAQVRAEIVRKIGYERIVEETETKVVDSETIDINHEPRFTSPKGFFGKLRAKFKNQKVTYKTKKIRYDLLMMDIGKFIEDDYGRTERRFRPFLRMENPSVPGLIHVEGVGEPGKPFPKTVREALAWKLGLDKYEKPIQLT